MMRQYVKPDRMYPLDDGNDNGSGDDYWNDDENMLVYTSHAEQGLGWGKGRAGGLD